MDVRALPARSAGFPELLHRDPWCGLESCAPQGRSPERTGQECVAVSRAPTRCDQATWDAGRRRLPGLGFRSSCRGLARRLAASGPVQVQFRFFLIFADAEIAAPGVKRSEPFRLPPHFAGQDILMLMLNRLLFTSGSFDLTTEISDRFRNLQVRVASPTSLIGQFLDESSWIFIDLILPNMSGIQMARLLRSSELTRKVRISIVLPEPDEQIQMRALAAGADEYILGPLDPEYIIKRVKAFRAKLMEADRPVLILDDLVLDQNAYTLRFKGKAIDLNVNELQLLSCFMRNPGLLFTRGDLIRSLGKEGAVSVEHTVNGWVSRLRCSLRAHGVPHVPRTVRDIGYVLDPA